MNIWESFTRWSEWGYTPEDWETTEYLEDWVYTPEDIGMYIQSSAFQNIPTVIKRLTKQDPQITYYNVPASFDIETTSWYHKGRKCATMYLWTLNINGATMCGRTWEEFGMVMETLMGFLHLDATHRLVVYVHNLSYEFQFLRLWTKWCKVFAIDTRKPLYAVSELGFEFRCSYLLSGYSLAKVGENLHTEKVRKLVGDLDYSLPRHSYTPITQKEYGYAVNDCAVVVAYIREQIADNDGKITKIPLTKTGYVRRYCREQVFTDPDKRVAGKKFKTYSQLMSGLSLTPELYKKLKRAFQGGFTHAAAHLSMRTLEQVESWDFTSSYPYVMLSEKFPMDSGTRVEISSHDEFEKYLKLYCCCFELELSGVRPKNYIETPISASRCYELINPILNNGRVAFADRLKTTVTEQDFFNYRDFYEWEHMRVSNMVVFKRQYLPRDLALSILKLYEDKTQLKGVVGKEVEYLKSKENVNSCYGMMATDILRMVNEYLDDDWAEPKQPDVTAEIEKYNNSKTRFLFYAWGVWVTAYARRNILQCIKRFGDDYAYSDTDSIKAIHAGTHQDIIDAYNRHVMIKLQRAADYYKIPVDRFSPTTVKGERKTLGVFDADGVYSRFKTLGAKRYLYEDKGGLHLTVAGVSKTAVEYIKKAAPGAEFDFFDDGMFIPGEFIDPNNGMPETPSGKNTHTYVDVEMAAPLTDYTGETRMCYEKSYIHLESCDYRMDDLSDYLDFIRGIWMNR